MKIRFAHVCSGLFASGLLVPALADELQIAVSANFAAPMQAMVTGFAQETGHQAILSFGATGKFYAQIKNGAPFAVLLAADQETPAKLERDGLVVPGSRCTYAVGRLVLWSPRPDFVDNKGEVLRTGGFDHLALAAPKLAPYGAAAMETMTRMGLNTILQAKFVHGENSAQAYQFVRTGNAELGFVALSQVYGEGQLTSGSGWIVPSHLHTPIRQDAVILAQGQGQRAAHAFMTFLQSDQARTVIRSFGYTLE